MSIFTQIRCVGGTFDFPFKNQGDDETKIYTLNCICDADAYTPSSYGDTMTNAASAGVDVLPANFADANAFWIGDGEITTLKGLVVQFQRRFSNLPKTRIRANGFYATTFPVTNGGDTVDDFTATSATLSYDYTNEKLVATIDKATTVDVDAGGAGTTDVNTINWQFAATTNGKPSYDDNGSADGLGISIRMWWNGSAWVIRTGNSDRYSSTEDVEFPWLVQNWSVESGGTAPPPTVVAPQSFSAIGKTLVVDSLSFMAERDPGVTDTCRGTFVVTDEVFSAGSVQYTAENYEYFILKGATFTSSTPSCTVIFALDIDSSPQTLNVPSFRRYDYVRLSNTENVILRKAGFVNPLAYGSGDYILTDTYALTTTPNAELYRAFAASGGSDALILAEDQIANEWNGDIVEIESILVRPL